MAYQHTINGNTWRFPDLKTLLAKASPARSGDYLAGVGAGSAVERMAARLALAEVTLAEIFANPLIPYETDEVTRLICDRHPAAAFAEIAGLSGTKFTINGYTAEMPTTPFFPKYRDREYLIVALIDRAGSNIFPSKDALAATTYFTSIFEGRRKRIGVIVIDRLAYESFDNDLFKTRSKLTILRHELGHVIGFSHSKGMTCPKIGRAHV